MVNRKWNHQQVLDVSHRWNLHCGWWFLSKRNLTDPTAAAAALVIRIISVDCCCRQVLPCGFVCVGVCGCVCGAVSPSVIKWTAMRVRPDGKWRWKVRQLFGTQSFGLISNRIMSPLQVLMGSLLPAPLIHKFVSVV